MVFPGSHWKFQRAAGQGLWTCARLAACLGAELSSPRAVPGNSSISLFPPRWQENETQAPPLLPGRRNPESGCWELGFRTPASSHTSYRQGTASCYLGQVLRLQKMTECSCGHPPPALLCFYCMPVNLGEREGRDRPRGLLRAGARLEACQLRLSLVIDGLQSLARSSRPHS